MVISVELPPETDPPDLGTMLKLRDLKITDISGDLILLQNGTFNTSIRVAEYTVKELLFPFSKLTVLHKTPGKNPFHRFMLTFGVLMTHLAFLLSG